MIHPSDGDLPSSIQCTLDTSMTDSQDTSSNYTGRFHMRSPRQQLLTIPPSFQLQLPGYTCHHTGSCTRTADPTPSLARTGRIKTFIRVQQPPTSFWPGSTILPSDHVKQPYKACCDLGLPSLKRRRIILYQYYHGETQAVQGCSLGE
jgi:hypothetical protein